jgi:hypothetical protein
MSSTAWREPVVRVADAFLGTKADHDDPESFRRIVDQSAQHLEQDHRTRAVVVGARRSRHGVDVGAEQQPRVAGAHLGRPGVVGCGPVG